MFNLSVATVKFVITSEPFNVAVEENTDTIIVTSDNDGTGAAFEDLTGIETITVNPASTAAHDVVIGLAYSAANTDAITIDLTPRTSASAAATVDLSADADADGYITVNGGAGIDTITAGDGGALITGNKGADIISGHAGTDTIVFSSTATLNGSDVITNFTVATDKLNIDALTTETTVTDVSSTGQTFTVEADHVYFYSETDSATSYSVETAANVATAMNADLTMTSANVTAYIVYVDESENNASIWQWTDTTAIAEIGSAELALLATVASEIDATDFSLA
jgi:hypothetical protein